MTDPSLVRARGVIGRHGVSPHLSTVRESPASVASGASRIPFERSSRIRRFPWRCRSSTRVEASQGNVQARRRGVPERGGDRGGACLPEISADASNIKPPDVPVAVAVERRDGRGNRAGQAGSVKQVPLKPLQLRRALHRSAPMTASKVTMQRSMEATPNDGALSSAGSQPAPIATGGLAQPHRLQLGPGPAALGDVGATGLPQEARIDRGAATSRAASISPPVASVPMARLHHAKRTVYRKPERRCFGLRYAPICPLRLPIGFRRFPVTGLGSESRIRSPRTKAKRPGTEPGNGLFFSHFCHSG